MGHHIRQGIECQVGAEDAKNRRLRLYRDDPAGQPHRLCQSNRMRSDIGANLDDAIAGAEQRSEERNRSAGQRPNCELCERMGDSN